MNSPIQHANLYIRRCDHAEIDETWANTPLRAWFWRLYWFMEGEVEFSWSKRRPMVLNKSRIVLLAPGTVPKRRILQRGEYFFVHFAVNGFTEAFWQRFLEGCETHALDPARENDLRFILHALRTGNPLPYASELKALSVVSYYLHQAVEQARINRQPMLQAAALGGSRLEQALTLAQSTEGRASVSELAAACSYSRDHFSRKFQEIYKIAPNAFLTELRLQKCSEMLVNTKASIEAIAETCGFNDRSYLTRCFRTWAGVGPATYRKLHVQATRRPDKLA